MLISVVDPSIASLRYMKTNHCTTNNFNVGLLWYIKGTSLLYHNYSVPCIDLRKKGDFTGNNCSLVILIPRVINLHRFYSLEIINFGLTKRSFM